MRNKIHFTSYEISETVTRGYLKIDQRMEVVALERLILYSLAIVCHSWIVL